MSSLHWSNDWPNFEMIVEFYNDDYHDMDIAFQTFYSIQYPIKGIMYKDTRSSDTFIFQDANKDYFVWGFYQERTVEHEDYVRRYKIPQGTLPEEFVGNFHLYKDMEDIDPPPDSVARYRKVVDEQFMLARIRGRVKPCACYSADSQPVAGAVK